MDINLKEVSQKREKAAKNNKSTIVILTNNKIFFESKLRVNDKNMNNSK